MSGEGSNQRTYRQQHTDLEIAFHGLSLPGFPLRWLQRTRPINRATRHAGPWRALWIRQVLGLVESGETGREAGQSEHPKTNIDSCTVAKDGASDQRRGSREVGDEADTRRVRGGLVSVELGLKTGTKIRHGTDHRQQPERSEAEPRFDI